jgi:hypothetical protein
MRDFRIFITLTRTIFFVLAIVSWQLCTALVASAQTPTETYQRVFPNSPDALHAAVHTVQPLTRGRLPILDGFVIPQGQPLESYSRGYYECVLQILPSGSGQTIVRAAAKITAWYTDPEASRSGYHVLPSNGRLENDALDQLEEALANSAAPSSSGPYSSSVKPAPGTPPGSPSIGGISPSAANSKPLLDPVPAPAHNSASSDTIETIRSHREANEKKAVQLAAEEKNLEDILHSQARPADLVIVKKSATPVYSKPDEGAQVLMSADAHDEFQILGIEGAWIHVGISGASRGWVRRANVNLPVGYGGAVAANGDLSAKEPVGATPFRVEKEETSAFSGKWEPLTGKNVRVVWVSPSSTSDASTTASQKRSFARDVFVKTYSEQKGATPQIAGVIVLFDSADGGQVAATMASLQQLENGSLAAAAFWKQCSVDPSDFFEDAPKAAAASSARKN